MPAQNAAWCKGATCRRLVPATYAAATATKTIRNTQENSQGTIHFITPAFMRSDDPTGATRATPPVDQTEQCHQPRHQHDIDELQAEAQRVDLGIELVLYLAQLLADGEL